MFCFNGTISGVDFQNKFLLSSFSRPAFTGFKLKDFQYAVTNRATGSAAYLNVGCRIGQRLKLQV
jgi:hypothetical protein